MAEWLIGRGEPSVDRGGNRGGVLGWRARTGPRAQRPLDNACVFLSHKKVCVSRRGGSGRQNWAYLALPTGIRQRPVFSCAGLARAADDCTYRTSQRRLCVEVKCCCCTNGHMRAIKCMMCNSHGWERINWITNPSSCGLVTLAANPCRVVRSNGRQRAAR
jgi:hypothetical protein